MNTSPQAPARFKHSPDEPIAREVLAAVWCQAKALDWDVFEVHARALTLTGKASLSPRAIPPFTNGDGLGLLRAMDRAARRHPGAEQARVTHLLSPYQLQHLLELAAELGWEIRTIDYPDGTARVEIPALTALLQGPKSPAPGVRDLYHLRQGREAPRVIEALKSLIRQRQKEVVS